MLLAAVLLPSVPVRVTVGSYMALVGVKEVMGVLAPSLVLNQFQTEIKIKSKIVFIKVYLKNL